MKIYSGLERFSANRPVVTIGMFDGIHSGHRELISYTIEKAREIKGESVVVTFWPHPRIVLKKDQDSLRFLTSLEEKTVLFSQLGIEHLVIIPFDETFSLLSAAQFTESILVKRIGIVHLVIGYNHRFGHDGYQKQINYEELGNQFNFDVSVIGPVKIGEEKSSSTVIRNLLQEGNIVEANKLLGYSYQISGRVVGGQQLGRKIDFPTANVEVEETAKLIPLDGVYACKVNVLGKEYNGMLNIGYRPTISQHKDSRTIEVHLLDFKGNLYSEEIIIQFIDRVRDERKFNNMEELKKQLAKDEVNIRAILD